MDKDEDEDDDEEYDEDVSQCKVGPYKINDARRQQIRDVIVLLEGQLLVEAALEKKKDVIN